MRVVISDVGHRFSGGAWLFRSLSVTLEAGRVYSLTGPSGSGKSTLLSVVAGWLVPAEGTVVRPASATVGWVFQNPHGTPHRTARDHVALPILARGHSPEVADRRADELLATFALTSRADVPFRDLSGGEAQRLMLARGIAAKPHIFLVDEPTAQLDTETADTVNASIAAMSATESIVIVATHDARTRAACSDHIDLAAFAAPRTRPDE